ncbi:hypothetical protein P5V83_23955 [Mycobacteroides abscessus subsp. abscessus]|uniref:hypothetical protein n=1 Tax=Mycobacteroides abscessus TaxID=36809 RepID=UPI00266BAB95|nr:hypothetical protein [Mycobacteroides abscessus]MDO3002868.1 hypothetical protein [Mycobacteroides abscessus subsp. abscessus]MDO3199302.1 hypothetical protein [Mycobacteroides abscessus subsp. abscessus]MDO3282805.1 hypothetical protein [Mycobacteroides abscessus subsp. abscessus]
MPSTALAMGPTQPLADLRDARRRPAAGTLRRMWEHLGGGTGAPRRDYLLFAPMPYPGLAALPFAADVTVTVTANGYTNPFRTGLDLRN